MKKGLSSGVWFVDGMDKAGQCFAPINEYIDHAG